MEKCASFWSYSRALPVGLAAGLLLLDITPVNAQMRTEEVREIHPPGEYNGVTPNNGARPPRARALARAAERRNRRRRRRRGPAQVVTWPGFQAQADGRSVFFLQTTGPVEYERRVSEGRVEIVLPNTRTHVRNSRRPLITRFYDTPVNLAKLERRGRRDLAFVFQMRADVAPSVRTEERGGYHYIYVSFPAGNYLPEGAERVTAVDPSTAPTPSSVATPASSGGSGSPDSPYGDSGSSGSGDPYPPEDEGSGLSVDMLQDMEEEEPPAFQGDGN